MRAKNVECIYVLSPLQQGILFHTLNAPNTAVYFEQFSWTIQGPLDAPALLRAWQSVVDRHPILRTSFYWEDLGNPLQVVHERVTLSMEQLDWSGLSATEKEKRLEDYLREDRHRGFELGRAPLMRVALVKMAQDTRRFIWSFHHILLDGWSVPLIYREVLDRYEAFCRGHDLQLERPPRYQDFIAWLRKQDLSKAEVFWRKTLAGFRAPTPLGVDLASGRSPGEGESYDAQQVRLSEAGTAKLGSFAQKHHLTLNTLVQGAWALLLSRYSGEEDIVFGVTSSGRPVDLAGARSTVGLFVNTLPLRARVPGDASLLDWLKQLQDSQVEMRQYEYSPLVSIQGWSEVTRGLPLFESILGFENYPVDDSLRTMGEGLEVRDFRAFEETNYPLTVIANPGARLRLRILYDCRRFDGAMIRRMLDHLQILLESFAADSERRLSEMPLLSNVERHQLLVAWNDTQVDYPRDACVHELFEHRAESQPHAVAIVSQDRKLTYRELNVRANQLAHMLRGLGIGPEALVSICMERSTEMVVAMLAVLKAGGAYVPLDPQYPKERLAFMLQDTNAPVLLTQENLLDHLPTYGGRVVCMDRDWRLIGDHAVENPCGGATAENLTYVMYTSGSTGRPKGVCVEHRAVVRLVRGANFVQVETSDVVVQASNSSFDAATFEIWGALLNGAKLVIIEKALMLSPLELARQLRESQATVLFLTTALFNQVAREQPEAFGGLRHLLFGGELVDPSMVQQVLLRGRPGRLLHVYGPTESTTFTTWYEVQHVPQDAVTVPIGRGVSNTRVFVLDRDRNLVPAGVPGELHIGGDGLARGYLNCPELTSERFVEAPVTGEERLYKTGDVVRWSPDGQIEFLGRNDHQVKIRGFRVELNEIESVLAEHPSIQEAVVLAREDAPGDKRLVAYVVPAATGDSFSRELVRAYLRERLPDFMVPSTFVKLESLPLNPNGKVDREALAAPTGERQVGHVFVSPRSALEKQIADIWREVLRVDDVGIRDNFFDLGGHSLLLIQVHTKLVNRLGRDLAMTELFQYPTVEALALHLGGNLQDERSLAASARARVSRRRASSGAAASIAVIGMAGRFPGAPDLQSFWSNLSRGVESVRFFTASELSEAGVAEALLENPKYVKARATLDDVELFDAAFFGYTPREAELIDPQQRLFLEVAWEALERAGYDSRRYQGLIGVYAGSSMNTYLANLRSRPELLSSAGALQTVVGNEMTFLTTRVSYKLNLRGPAMSIQTACSTSLVAVHEACRSLLDHQCDMALAGGVSVNVPVKAGHMYQEDGILSPDGHCRSFDARAQGCVVGNGLGLVVLKRLQEALEEGDVIHAVIRGTAINNDGAMKAGFTAPSVEGQAEVIALAQATAGVDPETIQYIEAHGTATPLGDPIEVSALTQVFNNGGAGPGISSGSRKQFCALGSVKTNVGHLDVAAGVAGLIKTVLALKHRELPPSLHFEEPNPQIDFANSPFYVNSEPRDWDTREGIPRRAGVSSFGMGGTNAHVVVEEAPTVATASQGKRPRDWQLLVLSAKIPTALQTATKNLAEYLVGSAPRDGRSEMNLADVAYTLQVGRQVFDHRYAMVCNKPPRTVAALTSRQSGRIVTGQSQSSNRAVVFMFPGQGSQYPNMMLGLYRQEKLFREQVDSCCEILKGGLEMDLREILFPDEGSEAAASERLVQTSIAQPALFVIEYALADLWRSWGIEPAACIGHSIGEYVAACVSGVFKLEDALSLVAARGRLVAELPTGTMLAVPLPEEQVRKALGDLSVAAVNGPAQCVVSGKADQIDALENRLRQEGVDSRRLHTSHAFHSTMMEPIVDRFTQLVGQVPLREPQLPYISNVTGQWIKKTEATDPAYWGRHLCQTVRFADGVGELLKESDRVLLEVGPGRTLGSLAKLHPSCGSDHVVVSSVRHPQETEPDMAYLLGALGRLWVAGVGVDWARFHQEQRRRRVELPTYPFERKRYWVDHRGTNGGGGRGRHASREKRKNLSDWFYIPSWRRSAPPREFESNERANEAGHWLVLVDKCGLGDGIISRLTQHGGSVVRVRAAETFCRLSGDKYTIDPRQRGDYDKLIGDLRRSGRLPRTIVHLWGVTGARSGHAGNLSETSTECYQDSGFYSLLYLAQALGEAAGIAPIHIAVVTDGVQEVTGQERLCPEKATVMGPCRVIHAEYPTLFCRNIDVVISDSGDVGVEDVDQILAEVGSASTDAVVAYRGGHRWVQTVEPCPLSGHARGPDAPLRQRGVYLITGGLGAIGLELAGYLARSVGARLVLISRSGLPERESWNASLKDHDEEDSVGRKIRAVLGLEEAGAQVMVARADVSDEDQMRRVVEDACKRYGPINGVIHSAGVPGGGVIQLKSRRMAAAVMSPKVAGTRTLSRVLDGMELDFTLLCSSMASVLGGAGQVDYCAANAYLDAFARYNTTRTGTRTIAINWDTWRDAGMAVETNLPKGLVGRRRELVKHGMSSAEGAEVFRRILSESTFPQILVSTRDLTGQFVAREDEPDAAYTDKDTDTKADVSPVAVQGHPRPNLSNAYVAPTTDVERTICEIWQELLGIEEIGVHDDFFELGGHSLLATQILSRLRDQYQVEITLRSMLSAPTVGKIAEFVEQAGDKPQASGVTDGSPIGDLGAGDREEIEV